MSRREVLNIRARSDPRDAFIVASGMGLSGGEGGR
jgi:hypothetical protein